MFFYLLFCVLNPHIWCRLSVIHPSIFANICKIFLCTILGIHTWQFLIFVVVEERHWCKKKLHSHESEMDFFIWYVTEASQWKCFQCSCCFSSFWTITITLICDRKSVKFKVDNLYWKYNQYLTEPVLIVCFLSFQFIGLYSNLSVPLLIAI